MSEVFTAAHADLVWEANTGKTTAEVRELGAVYERTTGGMSTAALQLAAAQETLVKKVTRYGAESTQAKKATVAYRRELEVLTGAQTHSVAATTRHASALQQEERGLGRVARGALAGTGAIRGLGRSVAFASSTFLGGAGLAYAITSTVRAGENAEKVLGQTENAVTRAGLSWRQYGSQIRAAALEQSHVSGFDDERLLGTFSKFVRQTKDVNEALRLNALASNVARGADIELEQAAKIVLRAHEGQARGLAVLGIEARKGASGVELLGQIQQKYANSAKDYGDTAAGAQDRFRVALQNTQEVVAEDYLPTLAKQLNVGADWLNQSKNQERVQRDVAEVMREGKKAVHGISDAYHLFAPPVRLVTKVLGGTEQAVKDVALAFVLMKLGLLPTLFHAVATSIKGVGASAVVTAGELNTMAAAEARAAGAAVGGGGAPLVFGRPGGGVVGRIAPYGYGNLGGTPAAVPGPISALGALGVSFFGSIPDSRPGTKVPILGGPRKNAYYVEQPKWKVGQTVSYEGVRYKVGLRNGKVVLVNEETFGLLPADNAATAPREGTNPRSNIPGNPAYQPPQPATTAKVRPLDRLSRINLQVAAAQNAVARGDAGAQQQLIAALKEEIDYDVHYRAIQQKLIKTDSAHAKEHAQKVTALYADEQSARDNISSIEQGNAQKAQQAAARAKAAREAAARKARQAHQGELATELGGIESKITTAQTGEQNAKTQAQLLARQRQEETARKLLIKFYERESHDLELTAQQRAAARKNAAKARQYLASSVPNNRGDALKYAVDLAKETFLKTTEGTAAYDKAKAALDKALAAEIAFWHARERNAKLPLAARKSALAAELAAQQEKKTLDKHKADARGGPAADQRQFLADVQQIIKSYAPNAFPAPDRSTGKMETHLYNTVHELRRQTQAVERLAARTAFPASGYAVASAAAVTG